MSAILRSLLWLLFIYTPTLWALSSSLVDERCDEIKFNDSQLHCSPSSAQSLEEEVFKLTSDMPQEFVQMATFSQQLKPLMAQLEKEHEDWSEFKRWLLDPTQAENPEVQETKLDQHIQEAHLLLEAHQAHEISKRRLSACRRVGCSRSRILELEDIKESHEQWLALLSAKHPWWSSESFYDWAEEVATKRIDEGVSSDDPLSTEHRNSLKEILNANLAEFYKGLFDLRSQLNSMVSLEDLGQQNGEDSRFRSLFYTFSVRYPEGLDFGLNYILRQNWPELNSGEKSAMCKLASRRTSQAEFVEGVFKGAEWGLIAASLATGPDLMSVHALGKLSRVFAQLGPRAKALSMSLPEGMLSAGLGLQWQKAKQECRRLYSRFVGSSTTRDTFKSEDERIRLSSQYQECLSERDRLMLSTFLSVGATGAVSGLPLAAQTYRRVVDEGTQNPSKSFAETQQALDYVSSGDFRTEFHSRGRVDLDIEGVGEFSYLNLSKIENIEQRQLARDYWDHVGDVYRQRLNLSEEEIQGFIRSSQDLEGRTKLLVQKSRGPPEEAHKITGGVAYVESSTPDELLPLEKATDFRIPHEQNSKSVEIVRLSSQNENPEGMKTLLQQISRVIEQDPKVKNIYVYTSKIHHRLYRRLNLSNEVVDRPNARDVIIRISAEDFSQGLR